MAKGLPYFKFTPSEWLTGDIVYEPFNVQGLFINICALYWQREGNLSLSDVVKRYKNPIELPELTDRFISVKDGFISISFLDEQFTDRNHLATINKQNGLKGGRPKALPKAEKKPNGLNSLTEGKANETNIEEEEETELEKEQKKEKDIYDKKMNFKNTLKPFKEKYGIDLLKTFYEYWTEPTKSGKVLRFEAERFFDTGRRLATFKKNEPKFNKPEFNKSEKPITYPAPTIDHSIPRK